LIIRNNKTKITLWNLKIQKSKIIFFKNLALNFHQNKKFQKIWFPMILKNKLIIANFFKKATFHINFLCLKLYFQNKLEKWFFYFF